MCGRSLMPDNLGLMSWQTFDKIIQECAKYKCPSIKFNWRGEPLIHPLLPEMVKIAKKYAKILEVQINTNGQLLTPDKSRLLTKAGIDRIIISIDGTTKETYEKIRIGGSWERLIVNLQNLRYLEPRPLIRIQTCDMPQNHNEIKDFKDFWKFYADEVVVHQSFDPLKKKDATLKRKKKKRCPQLWQRLVVAWNGDIHPCCVDWNSRGILGNINDISLKDAWTSSKEKYLRFLNINKIAGITEPCQSCDNYLV